MPAVLGAGLWSQSPSLPNQVLSNGQFCAVVRTRIHVTFPFCIGQGQHRYRNGTLCGASLDPHGYHTRICPVGGWVMKRHDANCTVLGALCEDVGCLLKWEETFGRGACSMGNTIAAISEDGLSHLCPWSRLAILRRLDGCQRMVF